MSVSATSLIGRSVDDVWRYLADPQNNPEWDPGTIEVRELDASPIAAGKRLVAMITFIGRREVELRLTRFEPLQAFAFEFTSGPITGTRVAYEMAPIHDGRTSLTRTFALRLRGWWVLIYPLGWWSTRRERAAEVDNVKRILEQARPTPDQLDVHA